jgi:hypothetical protein
MTLLLAIVATCIGCGSNGDKPANIPRHPGFDNFQTAVASPVDYDVYWLGREFTVGGLIYRGPDVPDFGREIEGGGLTMDYVADVSSLSLKLYSREAWERAEARRRVQASPLLETEIVEVNGRGGELRTVFYRPGEIAGRVVVIDLGRTVVKAETGSVVPLTPTPEEPNPLIAKDALLSVLSQLRLYPGD